MPVPHDVDRRQSERVRCELKARYRLSGKAMHIARARDISEGGLMLLVSGKVEQGDILDLELPLPPCVEPLKIRGRVVYVEKAATVPRPKTVARVAFTDLTDQQRQAIGRAIWRQILKESTRFGPSR
jgi:c-di-GMP-binding flagellar brake protein YcgR